MCLSVLLFDIYTIRIKTCLGVTYFSFLLVSNRPVIDLISQTSSTCQTNSFNDSYCISYGLKKMSVYWLEKLKDLFLQNYK
jgi:hypothetical protein